MYADLYKKYLKGTPRGKFEDSLSLQEMETDEPTNQQTYLGVRYTSIKGRRRQKKSCSCVGWYVPHEGGRNIEPDHNFSKKKYHFLFLRLFDPETFKMCINTITLLNLHVLPYLGAFQNLLSR